MLALTAVRPIDHFGGVHTGFAELSSGEGAAPFKTVKDYDNGLSRIDDFVRYLDQSIVRMRQGMASGVVQPKLVMANVVEQLDAMLAEGVEGSSFLKPVTKIPGGSSGGRAGAAEGGLHAGGDRQDPARADPPARLHRQGLSAQGARHASGWRDMPGGAETLPLPGRGAAPPPT